MTVWSNAWPLAVVFFCYAGLSTWPQIIYHQPKTTPHPRERCKLNIQHRKTFCIKTKTEQNENYNNMKIIFQEEIIVIKIVVLFRGMSKDRHNKKNTTARGHDIFTEKYFISPSKFGEGWGRSVRVGQSVVFMMRELSFIENHKNIYKNHKIIRKL